MPRKKVQTLTEQMFYILLCLREECCGMDIMERVKALNGGRVTVGPAPCTICWTSFAKTA